MRKKKKTISTYEQPQLDFNIKISENNIDNSNIVSFSKKIQEVKKLKEKDLIERILSRINHLES